MHTWCPSIKTYFGREIDILAYLVPDVAGGFRARNEDLRHSRLLNALILLVILATHACLALR
jgi:hypothetical protein